MMKITRTLAAIAAAIAAAAAHAAPSSNSLDGWAVAGDAIAEGSAITLTTAYLDGDAAGDQPFNRSGTSAADIATVEAVAGVAPYALDLSESQYGTEGSVVQQSFAVTAGQTLGFTWTFATHETLFEDRAFVVVDGQVFTLATRSAPGVAAQRFAYTFGSSGTASLALGVIDTVDYLGVSSLSVGGFTVSAVPEPASAALLAAGLAVVGWSAGQRRRR